jgi:hypothetical protein
MARLTPPGTRGPLALLALLASGCPTHHETAPPPAESFEVASAAPGALGALAAGTDAAPGAPAGDPDALDPDEQGEQPALPDAGAPEAPTPSAAPTTGSENVPL